MISYDFKLMTLIIRYVAKLYILIHGFDFSVYSCLKLVLKQLTGYQLFGRHGIIRFIKILFKYLLTLFSLF